MNLVPLPSDAEKRHLWRLAQTITSSPGCPKSLRGNAVGALKVMLYGRELGMGPMTSLAQIDLIGGTPTLSPQGMNALIRSRDEGHRLLATEVTPDRATVNGVRGDTGEEFSYTYTVEDARRAGLTEGAWREYPALMLLARATGVVCRFLFPDVLGPISYTPEELGEEPTGEDLLALSRDGLPARPLPALAA